MQYNKSTTSKNPFNKFCSVNQVRPKELNEKVFLNAHYKVPIYEDKYLPYPQHSAVNMEEGNFSKTLGAGDTGGQMLTQKTKPWFCFPPLTLKKKDKQKQRNKRNMH